MERSISGHHIEVTTALSAFINDQLDRLKDRLQGATHAVATITGKKEKKKKNGLVPSFQIAVHLAGKKVIVIKESLKEGAKDFYATIVKVFDTLGVQLERHMGASDKKHHHRERKVALRHKAVALA